MSTPPRASEPQPSLAGREIVLLVEDEPLVRLVAGRVLRDAGYVVLEAANGRDGLALASSTHVDAVVSDVLMPEMNGPEMVRQLRAQLTTVPVLFVTGNAGGEQALDRLGTVLGKPFTPAALLAALRAAIDARRG